MTQTISHSSTDPDIYLDYHSAKPVDPRVIEAMMPIHTDLFGNPSSLHRTGDDATELLERARGTVAKAVNGESNEIIFTSGATESINLALIGFALRNKRKGDNIVISEVEHISIHNIAKYLERNGFTVTKVPVDQFGRVPLEKLERRLTDKTILASIGYANNEIGTLQDIEGIGKILHERGIAFHSDATAGALPQRVARNNKHTYFSIDSASP